MQIPVIDGAIKRFAEWRYGLADLDADMAATHIGTQSYAGVNVNETNALRNIAVWSCVRILSETLASTPLHLYKRLDPHGKERATSFYLYSLLHDAPNPEMTAMYFAETLQGHLSTWGNAYAEKQINPRTGRIEALWPLRPDMMKDIFRDPVDQQLYYKYRLPNGTEAILPRWRVFHVPGFGFNGIAGYSPISMMANAIGLSQATEQFGSTWFGNGSKPDGVLIYPQGVKVDPEAKRLLKEGWKKEHSGLSNANRVAILDQGVDYKTIGIPPDDAQFLETRAYQGQEIFRAFRIPIILGGYDDKTPTYASAEQFMLSFHTHTMLPWFTRWEQCVSQQLLGPTERQSMFAEFLVDNLLRGDSAARAAYFKERFYLGSITPNQIREKDNENPYEGGDEYYVQGNLVPVSSLDDFVDKQGPNQQTINVGPKDTDETAENLVKGEKLNGAQITAAKEVITDLISGTLPCSVATELLVSVGIDRSRAELIIKASDDFEPKQPANEPKPEPVDDEENERKFQTLAPLLHEAMVRTAEHERKTISRQAKKLEGEALTEWVADFYIDFREVVDRNLRAVVEAMGGDAGKVVDNYVSLSKRILEEKPEAINDWVNLRLDQ